ncbi:hypothetical protein ACS0TY_030352 [Phlomoides rotata]
MSDAKEVELSLKVFINKEKTKVLFAEAENDFADVLLSFLNLSLGKIVKIVEKQYGDRAPCIGSLTSLYNGLANTDMVNLWSVRGNEMLDNPKIMDSTMESTRNLKVCVDYTESSTYAFGESYKGVFTQNSASFIICDDLRMVPNAMGSIMQTFSELGLDITDMQGAETRNVTFGLKEIIHLLKESLVSPTPLSDLIFSKQRLHTKFASVKSEARSSLHQIKKETTSHAKKMVLKVMFQKSTKKFLFAQAEEDFVEFLFSLLIIPLGLVERLLGSNTCLNNIDNLYRSIADLIDDKYLKNQNIKANLTKPVPSEYYSSNCFLLMRGDARQCVLYPDMVYCYSDGRLFVEGSRTYMVTDDLTVTRLCVSTSLSVLNEMKVSLSDVEEVELQIGLEEALNILKASLTSTCALTDGLINPKLK